MADRKSSYSTLGLMLHKTMKSDVHEHCRESALGIGMPMASLISQT